MSMMSAFVTQGVSGLFFIFFMSPTLKKVDGAYWFCMHTVSVSVHAIVMGPKLKFYLFPLTRPTLKKGPTQKNYSNFQSKNFFF